MIIYKHMKSFSTDFEDENTNIGKHCTIKTFLTCILFLNIKTGNFGTILFKIAMN